MDRIRKAFAVVTLVLLTVSLAFVPVQAGITDVTPATGMTDGTPATGIGIKASDWAAASIEQADRYGLVPVSIKGDYTRPITREEFAELAVKLYEVYSQKAATPVSPNPFRDCANPAVLKAFKLGIIKGVSATTFKPGDPTNREQIAAMLGRTAAAIEPDADMATAGAPVFNDAKSISPYFLENVRFMSKNGFITGLRDFPEGTFVFNPKGICSREMAVIIAMRVYEKYAGNSSSDPSLIGYEDEKGFSLRRPAGWDVRTDINGLITVSKDSSAGRVSAFLRGMTAAGPVTIQEAFTASLAPLEDYLAAVIVIGGKRSYNNGNSLIADFSFEKNQVAYRGLVNFTLKSGNAFFSGMVSPVSLQKMEGARLVAILESFRYRPDLMKSSFGSGTAANDADWGKKRLITYADPNENAFSVSVPEGWRIRGGTFRWYIDPSFLLSMEGENDTAILISEPHPPFYAQFPDWQKDTSGGLLKDGATIYKEAGGIGMVIKDYMDAETYLRNMAFPALQQQFPNDGLKIDGITDSSSVFSGVMTNPIISRWSAARGVITDTKNRTHVCNVITRRMDTAGGAYIWQVDLQYFRAPTVQMASFEKMYNTIFYSFKLNPAWKLAEADEQAKRERILSENQQEIDAIIDRTYHDSSDSRDDMASQYSNVILGTIDMVDSATGETFTVPNDSDYYWHQGSQVVGTRTQDNPALLENFTELREWR